MIHSGKIAVLVLGVVGLTGCGSADYDGAAYAPPIQTTSALPQEQGTNHVESRPGEALLQCVPYAREHSAIKIRGDAYTWWAQAAGRYERGAKPAVGTVMVLFNYAGPARGHVAVVRRIVSPREIRIDHADWLDDGAIYVNDPVVDVSTANDRSQIKVWNIKTGGWGAKIYPVQGFIGSGSGSAPNDDQPADIPLDGEGFIPDTRLADTQMVEVRNEVEVNAGRRNPAKDEIAGASQREGRLPDATPASLTAKALHIAGGQRP